MQSNFFKIRNFFFKFQATDHQIGTRTLKFYSDFCSHTYEKYIFSSLFYQRVFFCQFADRKVLGQCQSITCLLKTLARFLFFSLHKIKMSKQYRFILQVYLSSPTYRVNVNHQQSVHIPLYFACVGIRNTLVAF